VLEIPFAIIDGVLYYPSSVYRTHRRGKGGTVVEGVDLTVGYCARLCNYSLNSQSVIHILDHHIYHERMKQIDVRLHFMRDIVEFEKAKIGKIALEKNPVNMFTKFLLRSRFRELLNFCLWIKEDDVGSSSMI